MGDGNSWDDQMDLTTNRINCRLKSFERPEDDSF